MSSSLNHNLKIELNTKGKKTIPEIKPESIITIHGKNGVGKSNAATLLEIATGNYTFENEEKFKKTSKIFEQCEITFMDGTKVLFKANLRPLLWRYNNNINKINPLTLGNFYKGEEKEENKINFNEFQENVYIRTIRGNESLAQQIYFFKDIFIAKIAQKLDKLEKKISYLEDYKNWLNRQAEEKTIEEYTQLQQSFSEQLNKNSNIESSINTRRETINNLQRILDLLEDLLFISKNDIEKLKDQKNKTDEDINRIQREIDSNYENLQKIKQKLDYLQNRYNKETKEILKKLKKVQNKKDKLRKQLEPQFDFKKDADTIKETIENKEREIETLKKKIEVLNKKNDRIIEINSFLSQMRDICSKARSTKFGRERFIRAEFPEENILNLSFSDFFEVFKENSMEFKQSEELKQYKKRVLKYNHTIKESRNLLDALKDYDKLNKKVKGLEEKLKGKSSKLDDYVDLETRINNLEKKKSQLEESNKTLRKETLNLTEEIKEISKRIDKLNELPSKISLINKLKKRHVYAEKKDDLEKFCIESKSEIEQRIEENSAQLSKTEIEKQELQKKIDNSRNKLDPIAQKIKNAAKRFGFSEEGEFIDYFKTHRGKLDKYLEETYELQTRLSVLKSDISRILDGKNPKNKKHFDIINRQFDKIFKEIYDKEEFFKYVFKDYSRIKEFDITNKAIVFETKEGLEETRDLEEFSSGEKTYAYCRSIISMSAKMAKYNMVILDESYALLDHEHSQNLYKFQEEMVKKGGITKFINILPLKQDLDGIIKILEKKIEEEKVNGNEDSIKSLNSQLSLLKDFKREVTEKGYYQEINYPQSKKKEIAKNIGFGLSIGPSPTVEDLDDDFEDYDHKTERLKYSFILDGSNIARANTNSRKASIGDVIRCKKKLQELGIPEGNILIVFGAGLRHHIPERDKYTFNQLLTNPNVSQAPAGRDDDWFIIKFARKHNSYIITNDRFFNYQQKYPKLEKFIEFHSIRYNIIGKDIIFDEGFEDKLKKIKFLKEL